MEREVDIDVEVNVDVEVTPNPEPSREPFDAHMLPLDNDDDARFLRRSDRRRLAVESRLGKKFPDNPLDAA